MLVTACKFLVILAFANYQELAGLVGFNLTYIKFQLGEKPLQCLKIFRPLKLQSPPFFIL